MMLLSKLRLWHRGLYQKTTIGFSFDEVWAEGREKPRSMRWNDVAKIEAERVPTVVVDVFSVLLSDGEGRILELNDDMDRFKMFETAMLEKWPEIEKSWNAIFCGPPGVAERATLWLRPSDGY